jgi:hypothetical protein
MLKTTHVLIKTIVVGFCLLSKLAFAAGFSSTNYRVFTADINGDGMIDILLRGSIVPIAFGKLDIFIPVRKSVIITSSLSGVYFIDSAPSQSALSSTLWTPGSYQLLSADFAGNGSNDLFVRSLTPGNSSFVLSLPAGQYTPALQQQFTPSTFGLDFGANGVAVTLADQNGDGRVDISVTQNGVLLANLIAGTNGTFTPPSVAKSTLLSATWAGLKNALNGGNATAAVQLYAPQTQAKYQQIFSDLGAAMKTITSTWADPILISSDDNYAEYAVRQTVDGQARMYLISFIRDAQGNWVIEEM